MEKRYIGIDLHRNRFTCCIRLENEGTYVTEWELADLGKFVKKLRPADEVAVEITGSTRLFHEAVAGRVARIVGEHESVPSHPAVGEENRSPRRANAGAVFIEKHVAGGAHEG
jgi:hypothetical protein